MAECIPDEVRLYDTTPAPESWMVRNETLVETVCPVFLSGENKTKKSLIKTTGRGEGNKSSEKKRSVKRS